RGEVGGQGHGGGAAEEHGLHEDAGQEVVDVGHAGRADGAAEDVDEQQHEQHRLDRGEGEQLGGAGDAGQVAPGGDGDVAGGAAGGGARREGGGDRGRAWGGRGGGGHVLLLSAFRASRRWAVPVAAGAGRSLLVLWPVRARKTSSREGRRTPMSCAAMPAWP